MKKSEKKVKIFIDYCYLSDKIILSKKGEILMTLRMNNYFDFVAGKVALIIIDIISIIVLGGLILR